MSSRRFSIGGSLGGDHGGRMPLVDASSFQNHAFPSRQPLLQSDSPLKQKLVMMEESRHSSTNQFETASKRPRLMNGTPNSRMSMASSSEGTTALERFRMRKQQIMMTSSSSNGTINNNHYQQHQQQHLNDDTTMSFSYNPDSLDNSFDYSTSSRLGSGARRMSMMTMGSARKPIIPKLQNHQQRQESSETCSVTTKSNGRRLSIVEVPSARTQTQTTLSQLTTEDSSVANSLNQKSSHEQPLLQQPSGVDLVEGAGLRSKIREMNQRIEQLEKEKLELSIANAPLEARFRQKEDSWLREQSRLVQENESLKAAACEVDERFRDLQIQYDAAEAEVRRLRLEVRKASSSVNSKNNTLMFGSSGAWSRQLQNDRDVAELQEKLKASAFELESVQLEKVSVEKELHAVKLEMESIARNLEELQMEYDEIAKSTSDKRDAEIQLEVLSAEHIAMSAQLNAVCADLAATQARAEATLEAKELQHKKELDQLQFDMSVIKTRASKMIDPTSLKGDEEDEAVLKARIEERDRRIAELEAEVLRGEEIRRQMHNQIQELRGNVRVFVRTRPFLPSDNQNSDPAIDVSPDGESLTILDARMNAQHSFKFDKVFPPSSGQDLIFAEVSDFVQSALDGYQVCLFSYGQTGSGKTHTMQGSGNGAMRGIIPRAVEQILYQAKLMRKQRWDFKLSASFLEIYNEELKDLLTVMSRDSAVAKNPPKLVIKRGSDGKSFVEGLVEIPIETGDSQEGMAQLEALMSVAARARSVASTNMNSHSSRSHSVFKLHICGYNDDSMAEVQGSLNLCDLAGSERLDRSGASNDAKRLKETQSINKSLSALGDVFTALAQGASHIPYRNSKLTYLLQDCLSGDGKALMFVNLSPTCASSSESLCSLRFAHRVNQVELGKPTKTIQYKR